MNVFKTPVAWIEHVKKIIFVLFASITSAVALNNFFIPANVYASGVNGIAQLVSGILTDFAGVEVGTGLFILLFNLPIALLGWYKIGKDFTLYSFITSLLIAGLTIYLPVYALTEDPIMNAIFGGVISGGGIGYALKYGFSTGGMDIISMVLAKTTGKTVGSLMFAANLLIILTAGLIYGWPFAMYTVLSIFVMTKVIDAIHTSHQKVTAMIITQDAPTLIKAIHEKLIRGVTVIPAQGGYSGAERSILMVVITRYEMYELEQAVKETDAAAFVNFMDTNKVLGQFWSTEQQNELRPKNKQNKQTSDLKGKDENG